MKNVLLDEQLLQRAELLLHTAAQCHAAVNQHYGDGLPYGFHLRLTLSYAMRHVPLLRLSSGAEVETVFAAACFHDTLEDARLTYHDLTKLLTRLKEENGLRMDVADAVEAVYALTNDKGRNRAERAGDNYYAGIRATKYAPFLKMCDRLANLRFSTLFFPPQRMARVYKEEMPHFLKSIGSVPQEMIAEAEKLCDEVSPL